jgi:hypothetical protein
MRLYLMIGLTALAFAQTAQSTALRCGSQLISAGDRAFEVQQKCGDPVSQEVIGSKETFSGNFRQSQQVRIEEWIYGPSHGMYRYLRFEGGRLVNIDSKRGN